MVAAFEMAVDKGLPMQCKQRFAANFMLPNQPCGIVQSWFSNITTRSSVWRGTEHRFGAERVAGNLFVGCVSTLGRVMKSSCGDRRNTLASNMIHTLKRAGVRDYHAVPIASFPVIKDIQGHLYIPEPGDRVVSPNTLAIKYCFKKFDVSDLTAGSTSFQNVAVEEIFYVGRFNRPVSGTAIPHLCPCTRLSSSCWLIVTTAK